jgi:hypothetical protein
MTAGSTAVCDQQTAQGAGRRSGEYSGGGARPGRRPVPAGKLADGYAQPAQTCPDCASGTADACGPGSPDSHRVVWGLTSRPPVSPAGFPPVSRLPAGFSPFARLPRFPVSGVLRFVPFGRCPVPVPPSVSLRVLLPLSNLHDSAAAGRFRRRWSRAARAKVTSPAATPRLDLAVIRPVPQMGSGWARWDAAQNRPLRAAASAGHRRARTAQIGGYMR